MLHGGLVGRVDLSGIMAAARHLPDFAIAHMSDHVFQLGIFAEEILADIGAVLRLVVLVFAVDAFLHAFAQDSGDVVGEQLIPTGPPQHLDDVPAGAAKIGLEFLHDLAIAPHRPVEPLQIAVDDKHQIVEMLASAQRNRAEQFRLVHLAVAHKGPDLAGFGVG